MSSVSFQRLSHRSRRLAESAWQSFSRFNTLIIARASPYWAPRRKSWLVGVNARTRWSICIRFRARLVIQRIAQPSDRDHAECAKVGAQRTSETTVTAPIFKRSVVGCPERHPKTSNQAAVASGHAMSPFGAVAPWVARRSFQITHRDVRMALRKSRSSRPVEVGANSAHGNTVIHGFRSALDKVLPVCGDVPCLNHASPHGSVCNVAWTKVDGGTTAPNV